MKSLFSRHFLVVLFTGCANLSAVAGDAPDTTKPADIENMKKIGAALNAYKKEKGEFPDHLSDLIPDFLEAKTLLSPLGVEADSRAAKGKNDPKLPCSYHYEFSTDPEDEFNRKGPTRRAINRIRLEEYGSTTPIVGCFLYKRELYLSHGGEIFESDLHWTWDGEVQLLIRRNGYGPGLKAGKKLVVHLTDEAGRPVADVPLFVSGRESSEVELARRDFLSDAKGEVTIPLGTDSDARATFRCLHEHWFLADRTWTYGDAGTPAQGEIASITVVVQRAAPIGGVVRDAQGTPLHKASVYLVQPVDHPNPGHPNVNIPSGTQTDQHGAWKLPSLPLKCGQLKIHFEHPGSRIVEGAPGEHGVPDAAALYAKTADLRLPPPFSVKGTVLSQGRPVSGATVVLQRAIAVALQDDVEGNKQATTDAHGNFEIHALAEGAAALVVMATHLAPAYQKVNLAVDGPPFEVVMESGRPAKARLVNEMHRAFPNATVLFNGFAPLTITADRLPTQALIGITDDNGRFTWKHAPKNPVVLYVMKPSGDIETFVWDPSKPGEKEFELH